MSAGSAEDADWARLAALFDAALDLDEVDRRTLIERTRQEDPALAERLASLLRAQSRPAPGLTRGAATNTSPTVSLSVGEQVGRYRLIEPIGRGGMGEVWRAERHEGALRQTVALKFIGAGDRSLLGPRFLRERALLARLAHPSIARFLDAGELPDGRPWFAAEFVDGQPITDWCEAKGMGPRERVACLLPVLDALDHAHRQLIVHRDLKPANVLVGTEGRPRLLDFGIAKALDEDEGLTRLAAPMTPRYAAPEQLRGEPVGTSTDVYGAGVLLFELLTGRLPYGEAQGGPALLAAISEREPDTLLQALARTRREGDGAAARYDLPEKILRRLLRGELQQICARALAKSPEQRYPTARAFAEDLRAWLDGRPLLSRPTPLRQRLGKFVLRHRAASAATAIALLALVAGVAGTLWQAQRATQEAARAEAARRFLSDVFAAGDPFQSEGQAPDLGAVIEAGVARLRADESLDAATRARLLHDLGRVQLGLDRREAALELLAESSALASDAALAPSEQTRIALDQAEALLALDRADEAAALLATLDGDSSQPSTLTGDALRIRLLHSAALRALERFDEAERLIAPQLAPRDSRSDAEVHTRVALEAAWIALRRGRHGEALARLETATEIATNAPLALRNEFATARVEALRSLNRNAEAIAVQREALAEIEAALGPMHSRSLHARLMLAGQLIYRGQLAAAEAEYAEVIPRLEAAQVQDSLRAEALLGRASARLRLGRFDAAEADFLASEALFAASLGPDARRALTAREGALMCAIEQGRARDALPGLQALVALLRERSHEDALPSSLNTLALAQQSLGETDAALAALDESLAIGQRLGQFTLWTDVLRGRVLRDAGRTAEAIAILDPIASHYREVASPDGGPRRAEIERELALALMQMPEPDSLRIESLLDSALTQRRAALGEESPLTRQSAQELADWRARPTRSRS
jgi:eukaryotic-like serine/threonine-protein kinase